MNTAILLLCTLIPVLAASMFYVSDRRAAQHVARASPVPTSSDSTESAVDDVDPEQR